MSGADSYYSELGGLPPQSQLLTGRAVFTDAYAVLPKGVMTDIVIARARFRYSSCCTSIVYFFAGYWKSLRRLQLAAAPHVDQLLFSRNELLSQLEVA